MKITILIGLLSAVSGFAQTKEQLKLDASVGAKLCAVKAAKAALGLRQVNDKIAPTKILITVNKEKLQTTKVGFNQAVHEVTVVNTGSDMWDTYITVSDLEGGKGDKVTARTNCEVMLVKKIAGE